jgi:hypothetical protein
MSFNSKEYATKTLGKFIGVAISQQLSTLECLELADRLEVILNRFQRNMSQIQPDLPKCETPCLRQGGFMGTGNNSLKLHDKLRSDPNEITSQNGV